MICEIGWVQIHKAHSDATQILQYVYIFARKNACKKLSILKTMPYNHSQEAKAQEAVTTRDLRSQEQEHQGEEKFASHMCNPHTVPLCNLHICFSVQNLARRNQQLHLMGWLKKNKFQLLWLQIIKLPINLNISKGGIQVHLLL